MTGLIGVGLALLALYIVFRIVKFTMKIALVLAAVAVVWFVIVPEIGRLL